MNIKIKTFLLVIAMVIATIVISSNNPFIFAQSSSNQTGNNVTSTKSNSKANNSIFKCSNSELTQLGAATQAFLTGNENKALMFMNQVDKTLTGAAKMHLDAAINALQSGDSNMAKKHLGEIEYACGVPDIFWLNSHTIDWLYLQKLCKIWWTATTTTVANDINQFGFITNKNDQQQ